MAEIVMNEPNPKQRLMFMSRARRIGYGGARGGGKSWAVRYKSILMAANNYPGIRILIVRRTYPELINNHINPMKQIIPKSVAGYNTTEKVFKFRNGSRIEFGYLDSDKDLDRYQGVEYDIIFIDEATQITEYQYKALCACVRGVNGFPKRIYLTMNPGGRGHAWVKRLFIDRKYLPGENPEDYEFIQARVDDNTALMESDPEYKSNLEALPPKLRKAWLDGDWDIFEGQVFEEFRDLPEHYQDRKWTHVIDPFDIPAHWNVYRSYDFGYSKPFSCAWWTVDGDGVLYRILEFYGCPNQETSPNEGVKLSPDEQFRRIREIERQHPYLKNRRITGVADPAIWNAESGESVADTAAKYGIYFSKGDHQRIAGLMQMHYRLAFDENGYPMMYIFNNCKAFIRTIPTLCYSQTHPEDIDTDQEDHVYDEARYMAMSRPIPARKPAGTKEVKDDPLNMIADMNNKHRR